LWYFNAFSTLNKISKQDKLRALLQGSLFSKFSFLHSVVSDC